MSTKKPLTFEAYRRAVLKELSMIRIYKNFHVTVRAFATVGATERLAESLVPLLKACWKLGKSIEFTAKRIDTLSEAQRMASVLYDEEVKNDRKEERREAQRRRKGSAGSA